ncbi:hypothetical protein [Sphaerobacter thermophilus]|jgi:hypothetical protein|uniref:Uncharacterized protein n=1 Tax=Sphaerobacter thermophilus (strain ATCC 49802 / DSM 20745 / KCCM 41009 / NCIMB 13125 / S 6022) TaxID=479434 RepID=D1CAL3_SPHTD|nr:hypothetical protein [Sphaerobacter thermophilus]ACZ40856.1 hypothetical protein Sthe_3457 [Sphaerobacter thermophilus DSM 20745]PZN65490.1 MAG: hypothetical protein DIU58_07170 [Sphaerobacter thermophilus]
MTVAKHMVDTLQAHDWHPVAIVEGLERLELVPLTSQLGAGFTLWRQEPGGQWSVVLSGHTADGELRGSEDEPLQLPREAEQRLEAMLAGA